MIMHAVVYKAVAAVKMHERVAFQLLFHGRGGGLCIVVAGMDNGSGRQLPGHILEGDIHLLRVAATQVTAPAAVDKQGIAGNQVVANVITGRSRRVPGCMQGEYRGCTQLDAIATMMQRRQIQPPPPELRLIPEQVQLCIMGCKQFFYAIDVVMVAMREQDIGNLHALLPGKGEYRGHVPGGIDDGCPAAGMIMYQVDEIFHGPKLKGMD